MSEKFAATQEATRHGLNAVVVILVFIAVTYIWNPIGALGDLFRSDDEEVDWSEIAQAVEQELLKEESYWTALKKFDDKVVTDLGEDLTPL